MAPNPVCTAKITAIGPIPENRLASIEFYYKAAKTIESTGDGVCAADAFERSFGAGSPGHQGAMNETARKSAFNAGLIEVQLGSTNAKRLETLARAGKPIDPKDPALQADAQLQKAAYAFEIANHDVNGKSKQDAQVELLEAYASARLARLRTMLPSAEKATFSLPQSPEEPFRADTMATRAIDNAYEQLKAVEAHNKDITFDFGEGNVINYANVSFMTAKNDLALAFALRAGALAALYDLGTSAAPPTVNGKPLQDADLGAAVNIKAHAAIIRQVAGLNGQNNTGAAFQALLTKGHPDGVAGYQTAIVSDYAKRYGPTGVNVKAHPQLRDQVQADFAVIAAAAKQTTPPAK